MSVNKHRKVRIISGSNRGSRIEFPDVAGLRPTTDRVRETLFSWLQIPISGSSCLDMFAGSGALGFEAASRGAKSVVMIERHRTAAATLKSNTQKLKFNNIEIICTDAVSNAIYQSRLAGQQFDLVFVDPPFADALHQKAIDCLSCHQLLRPEALVYVEASKKTAAPEVPESWQLHRQKFAGEVRMQLYRTAAE